MSRRDYQGPALDGTVQYITEAPAWQGEGETVTVVDDAETGEVSAEDVPVPDGGERPDHGGQTTLDEWGWSV